MNVRKRKSLGRDAQRQWKKASATLAEFNRKPRVKEEGEEDSECGNHFYKAPANSDSHLVQAPVALKPSNPSGLAAISHRLIKSGPYSTKAVIRILGRAACVDLRDANITSFGGRDSDVENHHMTVVYREEGNWTAAELRRIMSDIDEWMDGLCINKVKFTLSRWGARSCLIHGPLHDLCVHLRERYSADHWMRTQKHPHVALFRPVGTGHWKDKVDGVVLGVAKHYRNCRHGYEPHALEECQPIKGVQMNERCMVRDDHIALSFHATIFASPKNPSAKVFETAHH